MKKGLILLLVVLFVFLVGPLHPKVVCKAGLGVYTYQIELGVEYGFPANPPYWDADRTSFAWVDEYGDVIESDYWGASGCIECQSEWQQIAAAPNCSYSVGFRVFDNRKDLTN